METYRYRGHSMAGPASYRPNVELNAYQANNPIAAAIHEAESAYPSAEAMAAVGADCISHFCDHCCQEGHLDETGITRLRQEVQAEVDDAVRFAQQSTEPDMQDAWTAFHHNRRYEVLMEIAS